RKEAEARREAEQKARDEADKLLKEQEVADSLGLTGEDEPEPIVVEMGEVQREAVSSSVRIGTKIVVKGFDEEKVPRAFLTYDPRKVNQYIRQHTQELKDKLDNDPDAVIVEGITFALETTTSSA
ncbi:unnamed protein product, partial [marine sediment metagenome]